MRSTFITGAALLLIVMVMIQACKKQKFEDALPIIEIVAIEPYSIDSVRITANITSVGKKKIEYNGVCFSNQPNFEIDERQILAETSQGSFNVLAQAYQDSTYYFRVFAVNSFGYAVSEVKQYTVPKAQPATAPCTVNNNTIIDDGSTYTFPFVYNGAGYATWGVYGVDASAGFTSLHVEFNKIPANGIYTTQDFSTFTNGGSWDAFLKIHGQVIGSGKKIYVAQTGTLTTVSFCNIPYYISSSATLTASAKVSF